MLKDIISKTYMQKLEDNDKIILSETMYRYIYVHPEEAEEFCSMFPYYVSYGSYLDNQIEYFKDKTKAEETFKATIQTIIDEYKMTVDENQTPIEKCLLRGSFAYNDDEIVLGSSQDLFC